MVWASLAGKDPRFLHRIGALFGLPIAEDKRDGAAVSVEADAQGFVVGQQLQQVAVGVDLSDGRGAWINQEPRQRLGCRLRWCRGG